MPFGLTRSDSQAGYSEILKFPSGLEAIASIVIDATTVASASDGTRKLAAGTLLYKNANNQYQRFSGASATAIKGVLAYDVEVGDATDGWDVPAAMFFHGCVFRADRIVDFGNAAYASAARAALPTCRFD
jgi:hypothetical protein